MLQIVYISTARQPASPAQLREILASSRRNNAKAGITGLLLAGGRRFLQALEGPDQEVLTTFDRIKADPRHFAVVALSIKTVQEREFGDWSMAFEEGGESEADDLRASVAELVSTLEDRSLRSQFTGFAELHARAA